MKNRNPFDVLDDIRDAREGAKLDLLKAQVNNKYLCDLLRIGYAYDMSVAQPITCHGIGKHSAKVTARLLKQFSNLCAEVASDPSKANRRALEQLLQVFSVTEGLWLDVILTGLLESRLRLPKERVYEVVPDIKPVPANHKQVITVHAVREAARLPEQVGVGYILHAADMVVGAGVIEYKTGLAFTIPVGWQAKITALDDVHKTGAILTNSIVHVDAGDYEEVVLFFYHLVAPYRIGDAIARIEFYQVYNEVELRLRTGVT